MNIGLAGPCGTAPATATATATAAMVAAPAAPAAPAARAAPAAPAKAKPCPLQDYHTFKIIEHVEELKNAAYESGWLDGQKEVLADVKTMMKKAITAARATCKGLSPPPPLLQPTTKAKAIAKAKEKYFASGQERYTKAKSKGNGKGNQAADQPPNAKTMPKAAISKRLILRPKPGWPLCKGKGKGKAKL